MTYLIMPYHNIPYHAPLTPTNPDCVKVMVQVYGPGPSPGPSPSSCVVQVLKLGGSAVLPLHSPVEWPGTGGEITTGGGSGGSGSGGSSGFGTSGSGSGNSGNGNSGSGSGLYYDAIKLTVTAVSGGKVRHASLCDPLMTTPSYLIAPVLPSPPFKHIYPTIMHPHSNVSPLISTPISTYTPSPFPFPLVFPPPPPPVPLPPPSM